MALDNREEQLGRLHADLLALEHKRLAERSTEHRHVVIGLLVVVAVLIVADRAWGIGLWVLARDVLAPLLRHVR